MTIDQPALDAPPARWHKALGAGVGLVILVVVLVEVVPKFASYSRAWAAMSHLSAWWWVAIAVVALVNQISGVWPYQAALPGLGSWDGFIEIETTGAIANTVPAGGAVAIGMTYKMFSSFGFSNVDISSSVIVTGIWNFAFKLALPLAAVALLAITTHPSAQVADAAVAGVVAIVVAGVALWLLLRFRAATHWLVRMADRAVNRVRRLFRKPPANGIERSLAAFKSQTIHVVRRRGWHLSGATLANQLVGFVLVLIIVRAVGITTGQVTYIAVFTSFAVARLAGAIPITPGGLGTLDAAFISLLTAFGASSSRALAADLIWRLVVYFLPIIPGVGTYVIWLRRRGRLARHSASPEQPSASASASGA
jgi:uncharacterized protein (TIRG00374 family)